MNLFANPTYNGFFLKGGSTAHPIAGTALETAYSKPLNQAKLHKDNLMQGMPVDLKNTSLASTGNSNNDGLSGNVLTAEDATTIHGFIVNSPNDVLIDGDEFPRFLKNQVVRVATIGSGATIYLPANANVEGISLNAELKWNNGELDANTGTPLPGVRIDGQVVEGVIPYLDGDTAKVKNGLVVKVIL